MEIKECCYNCHYYLSDYDNCQGMKDLDNKCFEYKQNMHKVKKIDTNK